MRSCLVPKLTAGLMLIGAAPAWAGEYRHFVVSPGLPIDTELLATEALGFHVRVEQGELVVPFDRVDDMTTIDAVTPQRWTVVLISTGAERALVEATLQAIPGVTVVAPADLADAAERLKVMSCEATFSCLAVARIPGSWTFFVASDLTEGSLHLRGLAPFSTTPTDVAFTLDETTEDGAAAWQSAATSLGLLAPPAAPAGWTEAYADLVRPLSRSGRPVHAAPEATVWNERRISALAFAPIPGLPSAVRHDWAGFAGAWASTAAMTAGFVGVTGASATTPGEQIGISSVGAYVSSVVSSQLFGIIGARKRAQRESALRPVVLPVVSDEPSSSDAPTLP
jgi:hypothetical protein